LSSTTLLPGRVVALGDLHGDIGQARRALSIAGVLGEGGDGVNPEWVGGRAFFPLFFLFHLSVRRRLRVLAGPHSQPPRPSPPLSRAV